MSNTPPIFYDYINANTSPVTPSTIHYLDTGLFNYFRKYLLQKALSVFEWRLPDTWAKNYFLYSLYTWGVMAVFKTDKYGVVTQSCGLSGYDLYYQPTQAIISNPILGGLNLKIGRDCEIIKLMPNYSGIMDIVDQYAKEMALGWQTIDVNLLNSKVSYVFSAKGKSAAESFKKMYDRIASGEPAVVVDKNLYGDSGDKEWDAFAQNVVGNYIVSAVITDLRKIENAFDTDIGIPNSNTEKRSRMLVDEVNSNNVETWCKASLWLEELKETTKKCNDRFGLNISVDWRDFNEVSSIYTRDDELGRNPIRESEDPRGY